MADPISAFFASLATAAAPAATAATAAVPAATAAGTTAAMTAPSILGGGLTGAGMMTAGAPIIPGLLTTATPSALGTLGTLGGTAMGAAEAAIPGSIESAGLVLNPATGTYLNPEYFALAESGMPLYTGGGSALSQLGTGLGSLGNEINTRLGSLGTSTLEAMKDNPVQTANLGMNIYSGLNAQPQQAPPPQLGIIRPQQSGQYNPVLNALLQKRNQYSLLG